MEPKLQRLEVASIASYIHKQIESHRPKTAPADEPAASKSTVEEAYLPRIFLKALGAHACHCQECDPVYAKELLNTAKARAATEYENQLDSKVQNKMIRQLMNKHYKEINGLAEEIARVAIRE